MIESTGAGPKIHVKDTAVEMFRRTPDFWGVTQLIGCHHDPRAFNRGMTRALLQGSLLKTSDAGCERIPQSFVAAIGMLRILEDLLRYVRLYSRARPRNKAEWTGHPLCPAYEAWSSIIDIPFTKEQQNQIIGHVQHITHGPKIAGSSSSSGQSVPFVEDDVNQPALLAFWTYLTMGLCTFVAELTTAPWAPLGFIHKPHGRNPTLELH